MSRDFYEICFIFGLFYLFLQNFVASSPRGSVIPSSNLFTSLGSVVFQIKIELRGPEVSGTPT